MKRPESPPPVQRLFAEAHRENRLESLFRDPPGPLVRGKYIHWDKLQHKRPPADLSLREWWLGLKLSRRALYKKVPLTDTSGNPFQYALPDPIPEQLHQIDLGAGGRIGMPDQITNPETRDRYYIASLVEEAITSSQLEGAATTRPVAKEMIRSGRPPRDRSERMILNNFRTMQHLSRCRREPLTRELVLEIHRLVTDQTLEDPSAAGRLRLGDEEAVVGDLYGRVFHKPPPADELEERLERMCEFANARTPKGFLHPALRSIILHFWLSYDHPFVDGNGRTARALFYWSMLHHGYWLCEFISISRIIRKGPAKYGRAFLHTETDDNDLTYFILYHLEVLCRAIDEVRKYVQHKAEELRAIEQRLQGVALLNHRQRALISHALRHPGQRYTIASHRVSHNVVYETARTDLRDLERRGLLRAKKVGKRWYFTPVADLEARLQRLT